jgi:hypothetical protein
MVAHPAEIAAELKTLRKGRGVDVPQIGERAGQALREVCGINADDGAGEIRRKLIAGLERFAAQLPDDLRLAVLAALAITQEARLPFYQDRIRWVARQLERDERTARRRVDTGIMRLAEFAAATNGDPSRPEFEQTQPGWRVEDLRSIVLPHGDRPEAIDIRRIVVEAEYLDTLDLAFTMPGGSDAPRSPEDVGIDVLHGGILLPASRQSSDRVGFQLKLPRRLRRNDTHQYTLRYRMPVGQMRPHYVYISKIACEHFDLRIRFDRERPPEQVRKVEAAFQRDVDDPMYRGHPVEVDAAGDVHAEFWRLTPGLAYGLRW